MKTLNKIIYSFMKIKKFISDANWNYKNLKNFLEIYTTPVKKLLNSNFNQII